MRSLQRVSFNELALRLGVAPRALLDAGRAAGLLPTAAAPRDLALGAVPGLLAVFRETHHRPHLGWDLPDWLVASDDPVWRVLASVYAEPMTRPASLPPSQGRQLYDLVLAAAPRRAVEIGSFLGVSTLWMASALRRLGGGHVTAVDVFEPRLPFAPTHCGCIVDPAGFVAAAAARAGVADYVTLAPGDSRAFARGLAARDLGSIDFLFIDGDHSVGGCLDDFLTFLPFVRVGGQILLHDTHPARCGWPGPRHVIDHYLRDNRHFSVREIVTEPDYGMALVTKLDDGPALTVGRRARAALTLYPHRALRACVTHPGLRRSVKPALTALKLRLRGLGAL
ncbi:MAG: O-methyltransferase [Gammaproteobacteria bacterium]